MKPTFEIINELHSICKCGGERKEIFCYFGDTDKVYSEQYVECDSCKKRAYLYNTSTLIGK